MSDLNRDPEVVARERGRVVVLPEPNQIMLDFDTDSDADWDIVHSQLHVYVAFLQKHGVGIVVEDEIESKSSHHRHVYLRFQRSLSDVEKICLQACFGSDPWRELMSFTRIETKSDRPAVVLFEDGGFRANMRRLIKAAEAKLSLARVMRKMGKRLLEDDDVL